MSPAVRSALADLDLRLRALDELRKALDADDADAARRAYDRLPAWAWPASVAPAVRELVHGADPAPERDWHPTTSGWGGR